MRQPVEERRVIRLLDMVGVPNTGVADPLTVALATQPARRRRIGRRLAVVTEKRNRVALDVAPLASLARLIVDRDPKKRHRTDDLTHFALKVRFAGARHGVCRIALAPGRELMAVARDQRRADDQPEDGAAMIAAPA